MGRRKRKQKFKPINGIVIPSAFPPWIDLPLDLTANILRRVGALEILWSAEKVCTTWWNICKDPSMWRLITIVNPAGPKPTSRGECSDMCRRAVDRSQGQLIDLSIAYFGCYQLLDYIMLRSRHLRRLTLTCCNEITATGLVKAIKRVPELEELHLLSLRYDDISDGDIETIGISCPMLKSFTHNVLPSIRRRRMIGWFEPGNEEAVAIAKSMPNLQHLQILGNTLDDEGLRAILDSCPHLESLDLRYCFGVDLDGALGRRCELQIQHLRLPCELVGVDDSAGFFFYQSPHDCNSSCEDDYCCESNRSEDCGLCNYEYYNRGYYDCKWFDWNYEYYNRGCYYCECWECDDACWSVSIEYENELRQDFFTGYDIDYYDDHDEVLR